MSTSPGRPPPPSANSTTGSRRRSAISNSRSFFMWLRIPGCRPAPCSRRTSPRTARPSTSPMPADEPVGGVRAISSSRVRRRSWAANSSGPYSTKLPVVDEVGEVLARGPAARARGGARRRPARAASRPISWRSRDRAQVARAPRRSVAPRRGPRLSAPAAAGSRSAAAGPPDCLADRDRELADDAVDLGQDLVLHLHRLEDDERRARARPASSAGGGIETTTPGKALCMGLLAAAHSQGDHLA